MSVFINYDPKGSAVHKQAHPNWQVYGWIPNRLSHSQQTIVGPHERGKWWTSVKRQVSLGASKGILPVFVEGIRGK